MKYRIELDEKQLGALISATEIVARLGMGQIRYVADHCPVALDNEKIEQLHQLQTSLEQIEPLATGRSRGYLSISNPQVPTNAKRCWDLYSLFRHRLAWDRAGNPTTRNWATMLAVDFDDPTDFAHDEPATILTLPG